MSSQSTVVGIGGMPTAPDVKLIRDYYPDSDLREGETEITHEKIAEIIGVSVDSNRFQTVQRAWRKAAERDSGKVIASENGVFRVLDDSGKLTSVDREIRGAGRKIRRAKWRGSYINRKNLTEDERLKYDRTNQRMSKLAEADRLAAKHNSAPKLTEES